MTYRRRAAVIGAVVAGLAGLSACEQPTPYTTVTVGSESVHAEAVCYDDGDKLSNSKLRSCLEKKPSKTLKVASGERLRFGVDPEVADTGWFLAINGQPVMDPINQTYRSFNGDSFFTDPQTGQQLDEVRVTIVEGDEAGGGRGVWAYNLKQD